MRRGTPIVAVAFAAVVLLAVAAASSPPVRVWTAPPAVSEAPRQQATVTSAPQQVDPEDAPDPIEERDRTIPQIIGVLVVIAVVLVALSMIRLVPWRSLKLRRVRKRLRLALPDDGGEEPAVTLDVVAARTALATGTPRNAVVACWMQLERDAAEVGLPRFEAETSAEYVERVIAAASVDPGPIGRLAALYREARFSQHELGEEHRARALDALERAAEQLVRGAAEAKARAEAAAGVGSAP